MTMNHTIRTRVCLALTAGLFVVLGAVGTQAADCWRINDDAYWGTYDYIEKDATTKIHVKTDDGSWSTSTLWIDVAGTGSETNIVWYSDGPNTDCDNKLLGLGVSAPWDADLDTARYGAAWAGGAPISIWVKEDGNDRYGYTNEWLVVDVEKSDVSGTIYGGGVQLVLQFSIDVNTNAGRDVTRLWVENAGNLQEGDAADIPNNGLSLFYESGTGFDFDGDESSATLYGNYDGNDPSNEQWGNNGLSGVNIPSDGTSKLYCYICITNFNGSAVGKTAQFKLINDGLSLDQFGAWDKKLVRIGEHENANALTVKKLWHVTTGGTSDGSTWASASSLTNALAQAAASDTLWVKEGNYTNATAFEVTNSLTVYGGFDGTEAALVDRALTGESVLDGRGLDGSGCVTISSGDVLVDHMVISNGYRSNGGGIYALGHTSLTLVDSRIDGCAMTQGSTGRGGGAFVDGGTLTLTRASFVNNTGGSAAYYPRGFGMYTFGAAVQMTDCVFSNNAYSGGTNPNRGSRGSGFYTEGGTLSAVNCTFVGNKGTIQGSTPPSGGGAGYVMGDAVAAFTNCMFYNNREDRNGANSGNTYGGGTLRVYGSSTKVNLYGCTITNSVSENSGGAFYVDSGNLSLQNCVVAHSRLPNGSQDGAAFKITGGSVAATNCTIAYSSSLDEGGAFYLTGGSLSLRNCILWTNTAPTRGADISNIGGTVNLDYNIFSGDTDLDAYVYDAPGTATEDNSQWSDPRFAGDTDFHVRSPAGRYDPGTQTYVYTDTGLYSPAIDVGDPSSAHGNEPVENGGRVNLGAYGNTGQASLSTNLAPKVETGTFSVNVNAATLYGRLVDNATIADVRFYYGTGSTPTNTDSYVSIYPPAQTGTVLSADVAGLDYEQTYYYRAFATNAYGQHWASGISNFVTGSEPAGGGPEIVHVRTDAPGNQSGLNWFDACLSLNDAMTKVAGITNTVWVATNGTDTTLATIGTSVDIYGGFDGTETQLADRALSGESIMNGGGGHGCIVITSGDVMIDHMVISNGYRGDGGGIYATGYSSLELVDCRIDSCAMTDGSTGYGGGAYVSGGTLTLTRSSFVNNTGGSGAYYARGFGMCAINATVRMTDCVFSNNAYSGGTNPNRGSRGGGFFMSGGTLTASNCTFEANKVSLQAGESAPLSGGGVGCFTGDAVAAFTNCTFNNNRADRNADSATTGGGTFRVYSSNTKVILDGCTITNSSSGNQGGAFYVESGSVVLKNSVVAHSSLAYASKQGGAFYITGGSVAATNCTIAYSSSLDEGGAFHLTGGSLSLKNCILATNTAPTRGADISNIGGSSVNLDYNNLSGDPDLDAYVYDLAATVAKANNQWVDPLFAGATDFHVKSQEGRWDPTMNGGAGDWTNDLVTSLCIDAGEPGGPLTYTNEPTPNGANVNQGRYGNTAEASKTFGVPPICTNRGPAVVTYNYVTMKGELVENDATATIRFYYGFTDGVWEDYVEVVGQQQTGTVFEASVGGLEYNSNYYYRCFASNSVGTDFADNLDMFTTGSEPPGGGPGIIHVKTDAVGSGSGLNWFDACVSLNAGAAAVQGTTNEIWVATNGTDIVIAEIATNVNIYGGFDGTETQLADRALSGESIMDGQGGHGCITITAGDVMMDHMVISNGLRTDGGGIYASGHSSLTLVDCRLDGNAFEGSGSGEGGGAAVTGGTLTLTRVSFVNNTGGPNSWYGRGFGLFTANAVVQMVDCVFSNNVYTGGTNPSRGMRGGALHVEGGTLTASNCTFEGNNVTMQSVPSGDPPGGGAAYITGSAVAEFTDCVFNNNRAVRNNIIETSGGGAFRVYDNGKLTLDNCTITNSVSYERGGAFYVDSGSLELQNCVVAHSSLANASRDGGGFFVAGGSVAVTNCTIAYSSSTDEGGAFYQSGGTLSIHNSIIASNTATTSGHDLSVYGGSANVTFTRLGGAEGSDYVYDDAAYLTTSDIITDDPLFASSSDFHLQSAGGRWDPTAGGGAGDWVADTEHSPCIDAGDPTDSEGDETFPNGGTINMGAYGGTLEASRSVVPGVVIILR